MTANNGQIPNRHCRLALAGEIDIANAEDYLAFARVMITESGSESCFTIDLFGVTFMGSSGLRMLLAIKKAATDAGMELRLAGTPRCVSRLLEITALADHFGVAAGPS